MNDNTTTRMLLTTAVFAAVAALLAGPASAFVTDGDGGDRGTASVAAQPQVEPGTIPYLSHGIGVDESQFSGATVDNTLDPAIQAAIQARKSEAAVARLLAEKGPIPYLSHGIGVDQSLFQGEQSSLGLTGDSPLTRVVGQEPEGLTGDSPRTRGEVFQANSSLASDTEVNWTWVGFGAGMAALLAAVMGALYFSARHRDRVALP
jgi:hypothetical protein